MIGGMRTAPSWPSDPRDRLPAQIIAHAGWRDDRCSRRYRDGEALLAARGMVVTDAPLRQWCQQFGQP
jgi:hypothetical protein